MQKKHVLFVSYDGMTDSLGQSQVLPYIREISKNDFHYTLISFEKKHRFVKYKNSIESICNQSNINWLPINYSGSIPIISTIWNVYRLKKLVFKSHKKTPFHLFHSRSHVPSLVAQMLQKQKKVPYLFDMRGFWADERVDGGVWKLSNPIFKKVYTFFKRKEIEFIEEANGIVSLTENGKNEILSWQNLKSTPITLRKKKLDIEVIPCCVDTELFNIKNIDQDQKQKIKKSLQINENDFVLGYVGSIGTWYMLPEMLDFYKNLKEYKTNCKFLFVSNEPKEKIISIAATKKIPENEILVVSCLHKEVPTYISIFNTSIYFILPAYSKKASSPTKQAELMAMGIPVVCNANVGDSDLIVKTYNAGWVVNDFNDEEYKKVIHEIDKTINQNQLISDSLKIFQLEKGATKFLNCYKEILKLN